MLAPTPIRKLTTKNRSEHLNQIQTSTLPCKWPHKQNSIFYCPLLTITSPKNFATNQNPWKHNSIFSSPQFRPIKHLKNTLSSTSSDSSTTRSLVCRRRHHNKHKNLNQETDSRSWIKSDRSIRLHEQINKAPLKSQPIGEDTLTNPKNWT